MSKHVLVTGGAGYIGSACVAALLRDGHAVTVVDDCSTGQPELVPSAAVVHQADITDQAALRAVFAAVAPVDAVIHCAAKKAVGESEQNPTLYIQTNVVGSANLLAVMAEQGIPQLIFSSTAAVYEPPADGALVHEETPVHPVNVYGVTKRMVEELIQQYHRTGKLSQYTILRYFNVAGDAGLRFQEQDAQNVFPLLAEAAQNGRTFNIFGTDYATSDGTCVRDYIHVHDLVDAHVRALAADASAIYNLGTGTGYSVRELIAAFAAALSYPLTVAEAPRRPGDPAVLVADGSKAKRALGWTPRHTLREMVESTLEAYQ